MHLAIGKNYESEDLAGSAGKSAQRHAVAQRCDANGARLAGEEGAEPSRWHIRLVLPTPSHRAEQVLRGAFTSGHKYLPKAYSRLAPALRAPGFC